MRRLEELSNQVRPETLLGVGVALIVLALLASYLYVLKAPIAEYRKLGASSAAGSVALGSDPQTRTAQIEELSRELQRVRAELYGTAARVPLRQIESFVIDSLDRISGRHAVELLSVKPGEASAVLMFEELPYDVQALGRYFDLYEWLREVETELRPMAIKQFSMKPDTGGERVALDLRLVAYRPTEAEG